MFYTDIEFHPVILLMIKAMGGKTQKKTTPTGVFLLSLFPNEEDAAVAGGTGTPLLQCANRPDRSKASQNERESSAVDRFPHRITKNTNCEEGVRLTTKK